MNNYRLGAETVDSVELKCMVVSRGLLVDPAVYTALGAQCRISPNPLCCNCFLLPDQTIVQLTDLGFQLQHLSKTLSWDEVLRSEFAARMGTPFSLSLADGAPTLFYDGEAVCSVSFPSYTDFYQQKTVSGLPFAGNAVLQGLDWVAFQCLWPCEFGAAGKPCEFCYSGGEFEACTANGKPLPAAMPAADVAEVIRYGVEHVGCNSVQLTGGSTFSGVMEAEHLTAYLEAIRSEVGDALTGDLLLYITPPGDFSLIDRYFSLGATRVACSVEVWDEERAKIITPGKMEFTTRQRHLDALTYTVEHYGPGRAFSNLIIGIEPFESLKAGATWLAERGIIPSASIWMPMGRPVMGSMQAPGVDFYRAVKELFAELYQKYNLEPAGCCGLNVCMERDIWRFSNHL